MAQREETTISAMAKFEDEPAGSLLPRRAYDKVDSMMKAAMYGVCCKHMCVDEDLFMWKNKLLLEDKLVSSSAGMWFCRACNKGPFSRCLRRIPAAGNQGGRDGSSRMQKGCVYQNYKFSMSLMVNKYGLKKKAKSFAVIFF